MVLPAGAVFEGVVAIPGPARIDGRLVGRIVGPGPLWIGAEGQVEADLELESVVIEGTVRGEVRARARIELRGTATVQGDLTAPVLRVADGSRWNGRSRAGSGAGEAATVRSRARHEAPGARPNYPSTP